MFKEFNLLSVRSDAAEKWIDLTFNFDVQPESVTGSSLIVTRVRDDKHIPFRYGVENDVIRLVFDDWFSPNEEYFLIINKEIRNIIGQPLLHTVRRRIVFKSDVVNKIRIVSPHMYEKIDTLSFVLEDSEDPPFGRYYVEIAPENRFYTTVCRTNVTDLSFSVSLPDLKPGQYYIRVRAQQGDAYGPWSPIATFIYKEEPEPEFPIEPLGGDKEMPGAFDDLYNAKTEILSDNILEEEDAAAAAEIEVEQDLEVLSYPENGVTPQNRQLVFEFDRELDPDLIESVIVIRKDF